MVGQISNNDESAFREEVQHLATWCTDNNFALNTKVTKEFILDYKKNKINGHILIHINGTEVEN